MLCLVKKLEREQETEGGWHAEKIKNRHRGERRRGCRQWACFLMKDWISCAEKSTQSQHRRETSDCICLSPSRSQQVQTTSRAKCSQRLKVNKAWLPNTQLTESILPLSTSSCFPEKDNEHLYTCCIVFKGRIRKTKIKNSHIYPRAEKSVVQQSNDPRRYRNTLCFPTGEANDFHKVCTIHNKKHALIEEAEVLFFPQTTHTVMKNDSPCQTELGLFHVATEEAGGKKSPAGRAWLPLKGQRPRWRRAHSWSDHLAGAARRDSPD